MAVVGVLLVSALMLLFFLSRNSNYFWTKKIIITRKHLAALILRFLLQLKVILCTFLRKEELQLKKNKLISCIFSITKKVKKFYKITTKNNKSNLFKTLLDYNLMYYYRVANYKCNRLEILPSLGFFDSSRLRREELLDPHPISPEQ